MCNQELYVETAVGISCGGVEYLVDGFGPPLTVLPTETTWKT